MPSNYRTREYKKYFRLRRTNKPVKTIYKKHSQEKKAPTKADVNKKAITTLARQVKTLQLNRYGDRQYQYQVARMVPSSVLGTGPTMKNPLFFCASSFYDNEPVYRGTVSAAGVPSFVVAGTAPNNEVRFKKPTFDIDIQNQYQWAEQQAGKTTVSRIEYLPLYMNHTIRIQGQINNRQVPLRYRFTMFKTKLMPEANNAKDFAMPRSAGAYWYMCSDNFQLRNHFSKSFHTVLQDKWLKINPPVQVNPGAQDAEDRRISFQKNITMRHTFKTAKPYKPNLFNDPPNQSFYTNVAEDEIIWIMISSNIDNDAFPGIQPTITIERSLGWRDNSGTTPNQGA